ncbi:MAG: hypothetical protein GKC03_07560 [Methanomassiliicoccales archaeon]|nr:hypothetical protein [Methanomassiliicoccales archaeon]NYT15010.1 hypothetical protein [Methanomassiliicoccales archaeon]
MAEKAFKVLVLETVAALMTAAFGLIAALAWNEAIKALIAEYLSAGSELIGLFIYAIIVTVIAVIAILIIARSIGKLKTELEKEKKSE